MYYIIFDKVAQAHEISGHVHCTLVCICYLDHTVFIVQCVDLGINNDRFDHPNRI